MKSNQKGFSAVVVLAIVVVIGLVGAAGWFVYDRQKVKNNSLQSSQQEKIKTTDPYEGWKTYTSPLKSGLSFKYPSDWYFPEVDATTPPANNLGGTEFDHIVYSVKPKSEGYSNIVNQYMCISFDEYTSTGWDFPSNWKLGKELLSEKFSVGATPVILGTFAGDTPMQSEMILYTSGNATGNHFVSTKNGYVVSIKAAFNACQQSDGGISNKQADFNKQPETGIVKKIIKSISF